MSVANKHMLPTVQIYSLPIRTFLYEGDGLSEKLLYYVASSYLTEKIPSARAYLTA
jgi:hypothetical protein